MKLGYEPWHFLGLAKPNLKTGRDESALMRGVKTSISVSRCRENPDSSAIFAPKFAAAKRALGGVDPCPEKGGRGGLGVNPDHPRPKTRTGCGWGKVETQKAAQQRWNLSPPISPSPPPAHPPTYFIRRKPSEECQLLRENFKLAELQNSLICQLQRLPLQSQRAH